jgi:hypothetical protein
MLGNSDDAGKCPNGLTVQNFRAATAEERTVYREWMRGIIVFYSTLLLISGTIAIGSYSSTGLARQTTFSGRSTITSLNAN